MSISDGCSLTPGQSWAAPWAAMPWLAPACGLTGLLWGLQPESLSPLSSPQGRCALILLSFHVDPDPLTGVRDLELELRRSLDGQNCLISEVWHRREIQVADVSMARVIVHLLELELRLGYQHVQLILLGLQSARSVWRSACSADRSWLLAPHQFKVFLLFFSTNPML